MQRFDGKPITSPYVLDDLGLTAADVEAVVVWEEVKDGTYSFISGLSVADYPSSGIFYDPDAGSFKTSLPYISFNVPVGDIDPDETKDPWYRITGCRPGNALIALRLKDAKTVDGTVFPGGTIIWSWHIWLTDGMDTDGDCKGDTMDPVEIETKSQIISPTVDIMQMHLGYIPAAKLAYYSDRVFYVRFRQVLGNESPVVLKVIQKMEPKGIGGSSPLYQWGRKDPLIPNVRTIDISGVTMLYNQEVWSPAGYTVTSGTGGIPLDTNPTVDISSSVQNPHMFFYNKAYKMWNHSWLGEPEDSTAPPFNRWNMFVAGSDAFQYVYKTVYDPCPPGYCILHYEAFRAMGVHEIGLMGDITNTTIVDLNGDGVFSMADVDDGVWFWADEARTRTFFLPVCGLRFFDSGVGTYGGHSYVWTNHASVMRPWVYGRCPGYIVSNGTIKVEGTQNFQNSLDFPQSYGNGVRPMKEFPAGDMLSPSVQTGGQKVIVVTGSGDRWD